jgi:hypothetical protein
MIHQDIFNYSILKTKKKKPVALCQLSQKVYLVTHTCPQGNSRINLHSYTNPLNTVTIVK